MKNKDHNFGTPKGKDVTGGSVIPPRRDEEEIM